MFRGFSLAVAAVACAISGAAKAADAPIYAPPPAWVKPVPIPQQAGDAKGAAIQVLLQNNQFYFGPDGDEAYAELAAKIRTAQGLSTLGNFILPWKPDTDTLTIHRLNIIRGDQVIDVLAGGKNVTVLRRETNLEMSMLDGALTAAIQPEGLQVGDVVDIAYTTKSHDPILHDHSMGFSVLLRPGVVGRYYARAIWPKSKPVRWRVTEGMAAPSVVATPDGEELIVDQTNVEAPKPPNGAPSRFDDLSFMEFSQFSSWQAVSALMAPLYAKAATLQPNSPIQAEIKAIASASNDPTIRAALALKLVEEKIRYLALAMNNGGYVPADIDQTWSRRFGDCKGKTVLLLALLNGLGIDAEPVLVTTQGGDGLVDHLPILSFDHVIVRARIAGTSYWLDGTRQGDVDLDQLPTPNYDWVLPLTAKGSDLEKLVAPPYAEPHFESVVQLDARAGLDAPAPAHAQHIYRGDEGLGVYLLLSAAGQTDVDQAMRNYWRGKISWIEPKQVSFKHDATTGDTTLTMDGTATMQWGNSDGGTREFFADDSSLGYQANFDREPGPHQDAPYRITYPFFSKWTVSVQLPDKGSGFTLLNADQDSTVAGMRYLRHSTKSADGVVTIIASEQALQPEFPAKDAKEAAKTLTDMSQYDGGIRWGGKERAENKERQSLADAIQKYSDGDTKTANALIKLVISAPEFRSLTDAERHQAQVLYGEILEDAGSYAEALAQLKAVTTLDDTSGDAWVSRFLAEAGLNNDADALSSLTTIAKRWPSSLSGITDQYLFSFISRTNHKPEFKRAHTELLEAMHAAHWVPTSPLNSPDGLWLQLALALLEDGQTERAAAAVSGVQSPSVLKTMLIDRRFDPVTSAEPQVIDISKAAVVTLASQQAAAAAEPNSLRGVNTVASTLVALNRPAEALAVVEQALKQVRLAEGGKSPFEDMDQINWTYDVRARALFVLGRYDEAIAQMKTGATNQEDGNPNVSQTLNLAIVLIHLGRPADALALVGGLSQDHTSGYGRMVLEGVRSEAYSALHDQTGANTSVAYLKAHVDDGPQNLIDALLDTGDMDGAAVETIKLLNNPLQRDTALASLQDYIIPPGVPPFLRHHHDLVVALRQRPDVKAAIDAVGRIELIPLVDDEL